MKIVWNKRVNEGRCLDCGKDLTKEDKLFDKDKRKHCKNCLLHKISRVNKIEKDLEETKRSLGIFRRYELI